MDAPLPELTLTPRNFTVEQWLHEGEALVLDAPYQRASVWDEPRKANLIRSMLMHLPVGTVVVALLPGSAKRVVDGKQRLETLLSFAADGFSVPGWWLHPTWLTDPSARARDVVFSDLTPAARRRFGNLALPSIEFDPYLEWFRNDTGGWDTRQRSGGEALAAEAELYLLVNYGGVAHTDADAAAATRLLGPRDR